MRDIRNYKITELYVKVYLIKDIRKEEVSCKIGNIIDKSFLHDNKYSKFHEKNKFKGYTFNNLYPLDMDKIYRKGKIYTFIIRTADKKLGEYFSKYLVNEYTESIKVLTIEQKVIPRKYIEKIYSITPVVIKCENGYWKNNMNLGEYERRLKINLIKKFNEFNNTKIDENFELFTFIKFDNKKPISISYKNINFLGDKLTLNIGENKLAQEISYFSLGNGLGEVNARGAGYVNYKWL